MKFIFAGVVFYVGLQAWAAAYSDAEIAEILRAANQAEISAGKLAQEKAQSPEVKQYGKHMEREHVRNQEQGQMISERNKIAPKISEGSKKIKNFADGKYKDLKKADHGEFDKVYIQSQIHMHEELLKNLDQSLIPSAKNEQLRNFLEDTKHHVQEHLKKAQSIHTSMDSTIKPLEQPDAVSEN